MLYEDSIQNEVTPATRVGKSAMTCFGTILACRLLIRAWPVRVTNEISAQLPAHAFGAVGVASVS